MATRQKLITGELAHTKTLIDDHLNAGWHIAPFAGAVTMTGVEVQADMSYALERQVSPTRTRCVPYIAVVVECEIEEPKS